MQTLHLPITAVSKHFISYLHGQNYKNQSSYRADIQLKSRTEWKEKSRIVGDQERTVKDRSYFRFKSACLCWKYSQIGLTIADVKVVRARSNSIRLEALAGELDNSQCQWMWYESFDMLSVSERLRAMDRINHQWDEKSRWFMALVHSCALDSFNKTSAEPHVIVTESSPYSRAHLPSCWKKEQNKKLIIWSWEIVWNLWLFSLCLWN